MNNSLKAISSSEKELRVGNYMILFGGKDLVGEFFTKNTRFESSYTDIGVLYEDFEHGLDSEGMGNNENNILGVFDWKSAKIDDRGIFVERVLSRRSEYVQYLEQLINAGVIGTSSEAVRGMVFRKSDGEITDWPLKRDTLTVTPMEPRMVSANVLIAAKALYTNFPNSKSLASLIGERQDKADDPALDIRTAERALRDAGFSRSEAKAILAHGFKSLDQCDAEVMDELAAQIKRNIAILSTN